MKTTIKYILAVAMVAGTIQAYAQDDTLARLRAARAAEDQQSGGQPADAAATPEAAAPDTIAAPAATTSPAPNVAGSVGMPSRVDVPNATTPASLSTNAITLNFRNAPLEQVLTYMSDAAGYTILLNTPINVRVTVFDAHPMSREKAIDVLNSVLNQNNLAAISDNETDTLTIMSKSEAVHSMIPVKRGNDPKSIPKNDEIVTQIIPIRFIDATQLIVDLSPFVSSQAIVVANTAANSIVITDTQANIRHLTEIIQSIDSSAELETEVKVFKMKNANPNDVVTMLQAIFPNTGSGSSISVGGRGGATGGRGGRGGGGAFGGGANPFAALFGGGNNAGGSTSQRIQKSQQVDAVADGRTQSVVVTAAKDLMPQIEEMINQVDVPSTRDANVAVLQINRGNPYQIAQILQSMFSGNTSRTSGTSSSQIDLIGTRPTSMNPNSSSSSGFGTSSSGSSRSGSLF